MINPEKVKVIILAGGQGTRLREETEFKPKPLVEVGGIPILQHIMKIYSHYGFSDFIVALGYKGELIKNYFLNYLTTNNDIKINLKDNKVEFLTENKLNFTVTLIDTGLQTMTGARIRKLKKYIGNNTFMVTYGDGVADIDIKKLFDFHKLKGRIATVTGVRPSSRFGELNIKEDQVIDFSEKPQVTRSYINGGFFVFEPTFFDYLESEDDNLTLEQEPLMKVSQDGQLTIFQHDGFWKCMDTYKDYKDINKIWEKDAPWKVW